jgi:hypothetical protein
MSNFSTFFPAGGTGLVNGAVPMYIYATASGGNTPGYDEATGLYTHPNGSIFLKTGFQYLTNDSTTYPDATYSQAVQAQGTGTWNSNGQQVSDYPQMALSTPAALASGTVKMFSGTGYYSNTPAYCNVTDFSVNQTNASPPYVSTVIGSIAASGYQVWAFFMIGTQMWAYGQAYPSNNYYIWQVNESTGAIVGTPVQVDNNDTLMKKHKAIFNQQTQTNWYISDSADRLVEHQFDPTNATQSQRIQLTGNIITVLNSADPEGGFMSNDGTKFYVFYGSSSGRIATYDWPTNPISGTVAATGFLDLGTNLTPNASRSGLQWPNQSGNPNAPILSCAVSNFEAKWFPYSYGDATARTDASSNQPIFLQIG